MSAQIRDPEATIHALPIWSGRPRVEPLAGGLTNRNFLVRDASRRAVVRIGDDLPVHGVMRFNELAASRAAGEAGIAPKLLYAAPSILVFDYIESRALDAADVRANWENCLALVKRAHREVAAHLRGPTLAFNVFHIVRSYAHTLRDDASRMAPALPGFLAAAARLEAAVGPIDLVFGHNDLLAANFLDDGARLWLIDWEYAGWTTPLFDLAGLAANNDFDAAARERLLEAWFDRPPDDALRLKLQAMLAAASLREAMWSMAQESRSEIDFDYCAYTAENLARFDAALKKFDEMETK